MKKIEKRLPAVCSRCGTPSLASASDAAAEYAPHKLAAYLYQTASLYTTFYDQCHVLSADNPPELVENRLFLCDLTGRTLHQGMELLGIRTPEQL